MRKERLVVSHFGLLLPPLHLCESSYLTAGQWRTLQVTAPGFKQKVLATNVRSNLEAVGCMHDRCTCGGPSALQVRDLEVEALLAVAVFTERG